MFTLSIRRLLALAITGEALLVVLSILPFLVWYFDFSLFGYKAFDWTSSVWNSEHSFIILKLTCLFIAFMEYLFLAYFSPIILIGQLINLNNPMIFDLTILSSFLVIAAFTSFIPAYHNVMQERKLVEAKKSIILEGEGELSFEEKLQQYQHLVSQSDEKHLDILEFSINELVMAYKSGALISFMSNAGRIAEIVLRKIHLDKGIEFSEMSTIGELHRSLLDNKIYKESDDIAIAIEDINNNRKNFIHVTSNIPRYSSEQIETITNKLLYLIWFSVIKDKVKYE